MRKLIGNSQPRMLGLSYLDSIRQMIVDSTLRALILSITVKYEVKHEAIKWMKKQKQ